MKSELASVATVLAVPMVLVFAFPYAAVTFRATQPAEACDPTVSFVDLSVGAERAALRTARTTVQVVGGGVRSLVADLSTAELQVEPRASVLPIEDRTRLAPAQLVEAGRSPFLPSRRADPPTRIATTDEPIPPAFSREELLGIERKEKKP